ncbi:MAG: LysM peptidoglycan-binding domain-containing protein [Cytophagaceae bacterium]
MRFLFWLSLSLLVFLVAPQESYSQKNKKQSKPSISLADKFYDNMEYFLAAQEYQRVVEEEPYNNYAVYKLAESNRMFFHYEEAERHYKKTVTVAVRDYPLSRYWHAQMLKLNGKYEEAEQEFAKFIEENHKTDPETKKYKEHAEIDRLGCLLAIDELKKPVRDYEFQVLRAPVNSSHSDYAPVIFENDTTIVITSAREESMGDMKHGWLGGDFSDMFRLEKTKDSWQRKDDNDKFSALNTKFNESSGSFNKDKTKFYFTKCDEPVTVNNVTEYQCAIYLTKFEAGKWSTPVKLNQNINMAKQWNAQPSVSPNADTLFFVSKRPGGYGEHDIWMSTCNGDDNWGAAVNMGPNINTQYIDMSPCYYPIEKTLFFSSNGREGFGGLDIFMARGENFSDVKNAGLPFNSNRDDFYFVMGEKKGYLSSNRTGGLGNDDIYLFNIESKEAVIAAINKDSLDPNAKSISIVGTLVDEDTKLPASDVDVILKDGKNNQVLKRTTTNDDGKFRYENLPPDDYKVTLDDKSGKKAVTADIKYLVDDVKVKTSEQPVSRKLFENIYFDFDRHDIRPEAKKVLDDLALYLKKYPEVQIEVTANTDNFGTDQYNIGLSERRGKAAFDYLKTKGVDKSALIHALGAGKPLVANSNPIGRQLNRRVEFIVVGGPGYDSKAMTYVVEPKMTLYSIAKKYNMTVEELKEMNNLRDESVLAYRPLRVRRTDDKSTIAPQTIAVTAKPGTVEDEKPTVTNTGQKTNRPASELGPDEEYYIVQPKNTVYSISKMFNMTPEELRELNGLKNNEIFVGQKLKVKKR